MANELAETSKETRAIKVFITNPPKDINLDSNLSPRSFI
jgi:hypothetical protein